MSAMKATADHAPPGDAHLSDADLVRHLDREGDPTEHGDREAHVRSCAACAGRLERLERQSGVVRAWLVRADHDPRPGVPPAPRRRPTVTPWLRAAIIVLLVAAPLAAVPPVRQWVVEQIGLAAPPEPEPAVATQPLSADPASAPLIRFTPAPGTFTIRLPGPARGSAIELRRSPGSEAVLEGAGETGAAPVVYDDGLGLPATPDRRYRLALPAAVEEAIVVVGGLTVPVSGPAIDAGRMLDLSVNR